jgi:glycosyltransferase involved in cell wall biosynthesis
VTSVLIATNMYPTSARPWRGTFVREQEESLRWIGVSVDVFAFDGSGSRSAYLTAVTELRRRLAAGSYDLVHAHYGLTGAVAMMAHPGMPIVTTFHGSDTGYVPWQGYVSRVVARRTEPIFVSRHGAHAVGLPRARVIPAGVDLSVFRLRERGAVRARLGWMPDERVAVFPGARSNLRKDFGLFSEAIGQAERAVGPIRIQPLEGLDRAGVSEVLAAADVTLMTSRYEGSPVTVKESLAVGTPVVSVDVGDTAELLGALPACRLCARDPRALAAGVVAALAEGRGVEAELRRRAEEYGLDRVAQRLADVYASVLENTVRR